MKLRTLYSFVIGFVVLFAIGYSWQYAGAFQQERGRGGPVAESLPQFVPNRLLVKFHSNLDAASAQNIARGYGAASVTQIHSSGIFAVQLTGDVLSAVSTFTNDASVEFAEPDYIVYTEDTTPNDPDFGLLWGLHNTGQAVNGAPGTADADIDAVEAWDRTTGDSDVVIAVIDAGVAWDHPDLAANIWSNSDETLNGTDSDGNGFVDDIRGWDFVDTDNDPYDFHGHGTHVAGTAAAVGNNGVGITGVAWTAKIMALRGLGTLGSGATSGLVSAIDYATQNGADIINASFGSSQFSSSMLAAITNARANDVLFVAAAGNSGLDADNSPHYPASYDLDNIISVAATDQNDQLAGFSNFGRSSVDVGAPGVNTYSTFRSTPNTIFFDDMESGGGNWAADSGWGLVTSRSFSPSHSWTDSPSGNYNPNTNSSLVLKNPVNLQGFDGASLSFKLQLDTESGFDFLHIEASTDSINWVDLFPSPLAGSTFGSWITWENDLAAFRGANSVYIRFRLTSDSIINSDGVYIDDVKITAFSAPPYTYTGTEYEYSNGTSMATPHVAGLAALILSHDSTLTYSEIRQRIFDTVDPIPALAGKAVTNGRINAHTALLTPPNITASQSPDPFNFTLDVGDSTTGTITIGNLGERDLVWQISDQSVSASKIMRLDNAKRMQLEALIQSYKAATLPMNNETFAPSQDHGNGEGGAQNLSNLSSIVFAERSTTSLNIAHLHCETTSSFKDDVENKLVSSGVFASISSVDLRFVTPSIAELMLFDAVLIYGGSGSYADKLTLSNNLADYVDAGGGLVTGLFVTGSGSGGGGQPWILNGRFLSGGYYAIEPAGQAQGVRRFLGTVHDSGHPIMESVSIFDGGSSSYQTTGVLASGATRVADWSDGRILVATKIVNGHNRADLGFYPPSNDARFDFWNASTDGVKLLTNALSWVGGAATNDWLTFAPTSGTIPQNDSTIIDAKISAVDLIPDSTYQRTVRITSNAPDTVVTIPASLTVNPIDFYFVLLSSDQQASGYVGDTLDYFVKLKNYGQLSDSYDLAVSGNAWPAAFYDVTGAAEITNTGSVASKSEIEVLLRVAVPSGALFNQSDVGAIEITSSGNAALARTLTTTSTSFGARMQIPITETFPTDVLNDMLWTVKSGSPSINQQGENEPSPPFSLELKGGAQGDGVDSREFDLSGETKVVLRYSYQNDFTEIGDDLVVSYFNGSSWIELARHDGNAFEPSSYQRNELLLPFAAFHTRFKLRFVSEANQTGDEWFVDDIALERSPTLVVTAPDTISASLSLGDSSTQTITLGNAGGGDLTFQFSSRAVSSALQNEMQLYQLTTPHKLSADPDGGVIEHEIRTEAVSAVLQNISGVKILWDRSHGQVDFSSWTTLVNDLTSRGATVTQNFSPITPALLSNYDIIWTTDCNNTWTASEINAVRNWLTAGGGLLLEGDNDSSVLAYNSLLPSGSGIQFSTFNGFSGVTTNISPHETTSGVNSFFLTSNVFATIIVNSPAGELIADVGGAIDVAYAEIGAGRVIAMANENFINSSIGVADNQLFANQVFDWLSADGSPSWLSFEPETGVITPEDSTEVAVKIRAVDLIPDSTYYRIIDIANNDLAADPSIPAALTITPEDYYFVLLSDDQQAFGYAGDTLNFQISLKNYGQLSDSYDLTVSGNSWPAAFYDATGTTEITNTGPVASKSEVEVLMRVAVPGGALFNQTDVGVIEIASSGNTAFVRTQTASSTSFGARRQIPITEIFPTNTLNDTLWTVASGAPVINSFGQNEPSAPLSLELKGGSSGDGIESREFDLAGETKTVLRYFHQNDFTETGDDLVVSYFDGSSWVELERHDGNAFEASSYQRNEVLLPAAAYHERFKVRFVSEANNTSDRWYIDNIAFKRSPTIVVTAPDSLMANLPPGDSTMTSFTVSNTGEDTLHFDVSSSVVAENSQSLLQSYTLTLPHRSAAAFGETGSEEHKQVEPITALLQNLSGVRILWDRSHGQPGFVGWSTLVTDLQTRGALVIESFAPITASSLQQFDVLWTADCFDNWTTGQISAVQNWLNDGGGLMLEGDNSSTVSAYNKLLPSGAGLTYFSSFGGGGITTNIFPHQTTRNVESFSILFNPSATIAATTPAGQLILNTFGAPNVVYSEVGAGKIMAMAGENFSNNIIIGAENQLFANQTFDWLSGRGPAPWLSFSPTAGALAPGEAAQIEVTFNATGLVNDSTYFADIEIDNDDPTNRSPEIPTKLVTTPLCLEPSHFTFTANTGNSYALVIDKAVLDGMDLTNCDEVGVFTPAGLCVGAAVVDGNWPLGLTAWEDDQQTSEIDGFIPGEEMSFRVFDHSSGENEDFPASATYTAGDGKFGTDLFSRLSLLEAKSTVRQVIPLRQGWDWISLNVRPTQPSPDSVFKDVVNNLNILKDCAGSFWIPGVINQIQSISALESYILNMQAPDTLIVDGKEIAVDTPIFLSPGWSCPGYLPKTALATEVALASVWANLNIIKDEDGNFTIPGIINSLPTMNPGEGYQMNMGALDTLIYPTNTAAAIFAKTKRGATPTFTAHRTSQHFVAARKGGESFSIVIEAVESNQLRLEDGDEIGVFTDAGLLVGAAAWVAESAIPIAAWADDPQTEEVDGYRQGERMVFRIWRTNKGEEIEAEADFSHGENVFGEGSYAVVKLNTVEIPDSYLLEQNYPNPFNPETRITFGMPEAGRVFITVHNVLGQRVRTLVDADYESGYHQIIWNATNDHGVRVASGIYFYRMRTGKNTVLQKRMLLLK